MNIRNAMFIKHIFSDISFISLNKLSSLVNAGAYVINLIKKVCVFHKTCHYAFNCFCFHLKNQEVCIVYNLTIYKAIYHLSMLDKQLLRK